MSHRLIVLVVVVFVILVAGMFGFAYVQKSSVPDTVVTPIADLPADRYNITRIEATHFYIDGVHTIVGEISLPTPCDLLTTSARVAESMPEQITFDFSVINNSESCAQVVTTARFKIPATASNSASLSAMFMGRKVELNLTEAAPGETPDDFELFIKG